MSTKKDVHKERVASMRAYIQDKIRLFSRPPKQTGDDLVVGVLKEMQRIIRNRS